MADFSFIDTEQLDFIREDGEVIVINVDSVADAEQWLLENGKRIGVATTGIRYYNWTEAESNRALLNGFWFDNESGATVTVVAVTDKWCLVRDTKRKCTYDLPVEFVMDIYRDRNNEEE